MHGDMIIPTEIKGNIVFKSFIKVNLHLKKSILIVDKSYINLLGKHIYMYYFSHKCVSLIFID
jgi:hypothetical protein